MKKTFKPGTLLNPVPAVMVSLGEGDEQNIITIGWTGIINSDPPITYISVRKSRYSHDIIEKNGEFVINVTTEKLAFATDYCGVKSGRDINKFEEMDLTPVQGDLVKCPMIKESPINLECKVIEKKEYPTHDMFIAEIVQVHVDEELIDEKGKIDFAKAKLLAYAHGEYFGLRKTPIGSFGYSVMKPKTKKKKSKEAHEERVKKNREKREANELNKAKEAKQEEGLNLKRKDNSRLRDSQKGRTISKASGSFRKTEYKGAHRKSEGSDRFEKNRGEFKGDRRDFKRDSDRNFKGGFKRDSDRDFKHDFKRDSDRNFKGDFKRGTDRNFKGDFKRDSNRNFKGDFKRDSDRNFKGDFKRDSNREFKRDFQKDSTRDREKDNYFKEKRAKEFAKLRKNFKPAGYNSNKPRN